MNDAQRILETLTKRIGDEKTAIEVMSDLNKSGNLCINKRETVPQRALATMTALSNFKRIKSNFFKGSSVGVCSVLLGKLRVAVLEAVNLGVENQRLLNEKRKKKNYQFLTSEIAKMKERGDLPDFLKSQAGFKDEYIDEFVYEDASLKQLIAEGKVLGDVIWLKPRILKWEDFNLEQIKSAEESFTDIQNLVRDSMANAFHNGYKFFDVPVPVIAKDLVDNDSSFEETPLKTIESALRALGYPVTTNGE